MMEMSAQELGTFGPPELAANDRAVASSSCQLTAFSFQLSASCGDLAERQEPYSCKAGTECSAVATLPHHHPLER
jgi:hypothetical protein